MQKLCEIFYPPRRPPLMPGIHHLASNISYQTITDSKEDNLVPAANVIHLHLSAFRIKLGY